MSDPLRPLEITSLDIDVTTISMEKMTTLRREFPELNDTTIAKFYFARNGDLTKIIDMIKASMEWRKTFNFPVLKSSIPNEIKSGKLYFHGHDKEGHPLIVYTVALSKPSERDLDEAIRHLVWWVEYMLKNSLKTVSKVTVIFNRNDFKQENVDMEVMKAASNVLQNNYPEILLRTIVYPSGLIFYGLWNIIKFFLDPVTQSKVKPVIYLAGVQEFVDDEYIPVSMGGTCTYVYDHNDFLDPVEEEDTLTDKSSASSSAKAECESSET